jgi:competence protein ComGC
MKYKNLTNDLISNNTKRDQGLALIEVIISITILSFVLLRIYPIFILNMEIIGDSKNHTKALMIAKSLMNEFRNNNMQEADISDSPIDNYPDFTYDRTTIRYEDGFITPMIEPLIINKATIKVKWKYKEKEKSSELSMIYQAK